MPGSSPLYPSQLPNMTDMRVVVDDVDDVIATDHNDVAQEIVAMAKELGLLPKGDCVDVTARLAQSINNNGTFKPAALVTTVPTYPTSAGVPGERAYDNTNAYFCYDTDTWKRAGMAGW